jgi:hypothetical protein
MLHFFYPCLRLLLALTVIHFKYSFEIFILCIWMLTWMSVLYHLCQGPASAWKGVLREEVSGSGKKNNLKSNCGSELMTCVLLETVFPVCFSLCSAFSLENFREFIFIYIYVYPYIFYNFGESIFCLPAILRDLSVHALLVRGVCVCVCVCVCVFSKQFSFYPKKVLWIAHFLQNTCPVFYFTYQSSHLLQVFLLIICVPGPHPLDS